MVYSCIALSIYCKQTGEAALAHITTNDPNIFEYMGRIRQLFRGDAFTATISSPLASLSFRQRVKEAIKKHFNADADLGEIDPKYGRYDVAFDVSAGNLFIEKLIPMG